MAKEENIVFEVDDLRASILAWVKDSSSKPDTYLTKEGLAYLNGFVQANNTIALIKQEKYEQLTKDYAELLGKYENQSNHIEYLKKKVKRSWFGNLFK